MLEDSSMRMMNRSEGLQSASPLRSVHRERRTYASQGGSGPTHSNRGNSLLVRNLKFSTSTLEVREFFEAFGPVRDVYLPTEYYSRQPRGFGFVEFHHVEDAKAAIAACQPDAALGGARITVTFAQQGRKSPDTMRSRDPCTFRGVVESGGSAWEGRGARGRGSNVDASRSRSYRHGDCNYDRYQSCKYYSADRTDYGRHRPRSFDRPSRRDDVFKGGYVRDYDGTPDASAAHPRYDERDGYGRYRRDFERRGASSGMPGGYSKAGRSYGSSPGDYGPYGFRGSCAQGTRDPRRRADRYGEFRGDAHDRGYYDRDQRAHKSFIGGPIRDRNISGDSYTSRGHPEVCVAGDELAGDRLAGDGLGGPRSDPLQEGCFGRKRDEHVVAQCEEKALHGRLPDHVEQQRNDSRGGEGIVA